MGLGFVLFAWTVICCVVAVPIAAALGAWSWRWGQTAGSPSLWRVTAAAVFPFLLIPFGLAYFIGYALYSNAVRHVDPGVGDGWQVPLGNDYYLCMIDDTTEGYVLKGGCTGSPPLAAITRLAQQRERLVGVSRGDPFTFSLTSGELTWYHTLPEALAQFSAPPDIMSTEAFYHSRRWAWQDLAAAVTLVACIAGSAILWFRWFIRPPSVPPASPVMATPQNDRMQLTRPG